MAKKRTLLVEVPDPEEARTGEEEKARESTWEEWLKGTYSRYWYFIIFLFIDISIALELARAVGDPWSYFLPFIVVGAMVFLEWRLYLRIWGKGRKAERSED